MQWRAEGGASADAVAVHRGANEPKPRASAASSSRSAPTRRLRPRADRRRLPLLAGAPDRPVDAIAWATARGWSGAPALGESRCAPSACAREFDAGDILLATVDDTTRIRDRSLTGGLKASRLLDNEHSLVGGIELETVKRSETRTTLRDGTPLLDRLRRQPRGQSSRSAAYAQDEWTVNPHWAAHAGPALGGHHDARHRRRRRAAEQPQQRVDAAAACGVEARPERPRPDPHEPHAQLQVAHAGQPARAAERSAFRCRAPTRRPAPTVPATPT